MPAIIRVAIFLFLLFGTQTFGQRLQSNLESPYQCVTNHLTHLNPKHYDPNLSAASFLHEDSVFRVELAIRLKRVFDGKGLYVPVNKIPDNSDFVDSLTGQHRYTIFPERLPEIYLERINQSWYYSPSCYPDIMRLYKEVYPLGADLLLRYLPRFNDRKLMGIFLWQYMGILFVLLLSIILFYLLNIVLNPIIKWISELSFKRHLELPSRYKKASRVLSLLLITAFLKYGFALLQLPIRFSVWLITGLDITVIALWSLLVYRIFDIIMSFVGQVVKGTRSKMDDQILPIIHQAVKLMIIVAAIIKILILLDINVTALIAGISIGGLALALAAQDTLRNFIGSLLIFIDKPFQVEDWIEIDDMAGTVIEVGFRSTRIQQLDTSIISIPNGIISNKALTNKGLRVYRLFQTTLGLSYDTPRSYLQTYLEGLRTIAELHPKIADNRYIYLQSLGSSSIDILFRVFINTHIYQEELQIKEELTFQMIELAEELGVRFAFPTQTIYIEQFPGQKDILSDYSLTPEELEETLKSFKNNVITKYEKS